MAGMTGQQLYQKQKLFSIYVHRTPGEAGSPPGSIFHGRDIGNRCAGAEDACHSVLFPTM